MATSKIGIRDYLKAAGYKDEDIGYDPGTSPGSSRVTLNGSTFTYATPEADNKTYGDTDSLSKALQNYRQGQLQSQTGSILSQLQQSASAPAVQYTAPEAFQYDADSDPAYQAALKTAQANIKQQQSDTNARLRATGQGKSSYSETVANQIGDKEMANVSTNVLPTLISQAYQRWADQANRNLQIQQANASAESDRQNRLAQALSATSGLYQQDVQNQQALDQATLAQRQANLSAAATVGQQLGRVLEAKDDWQNLYNQDEAPLNVQGQQLQYQQARDQIADEQYKQKFDEDVRQFGLTYALQAASQANQFANTAADNARQNASLGLQQQRLNWEMSADNPDNMAKINAISNGSKTSLSAIANQLNRTFGQYDEATGKLTGITSPSELRRAIISMNLSDAETDQLLGMYGLPTN